MNTPKKELRILRYPDPRLKEVAREVAEIDDEVRLLAENMLHTMYLAKGIGLAATQVGEPRRIIVSDVSKDRNNPICIINPKIIARDGERQSEEGCLSVPGYRDKVKRSERVTVSGIDLSGAGIEIEADGLLAACIQHEIDHLDGRLFVDYLSKLRQERARERVRKASR